MKRYVFPLCLALMGFGLSSCTTYVENSRPGYAYHHDRPTPRPHHFDDRNDRFETYHRDRYDGDRRNAHYRSSRDRYRHRDDTRIIDARVRADVHAPVRVL